ncbi:hypothetical protein ABT340_04710 [Streptosporangium sp. NPDC000239]|uniref:hypothetical protein n=1 Tax=Streptosporangium sp. NPDC000239 TaxID=3154248 RepID=UPI00332B5AA7
MATYVRATGGHVAERVQPEPGSEDEARLDELVADPTSGWRRVEVVEPPRNPEVPTGRPAQSAPKATWVEWAVGHGMDRSIADGLTKTELIGLADQIDPDPEED